MPIDPSQVQWDDASPTTTQGINPATVQWDSTPEPSKVGASSDIGSLAQAAFKDAASHATPAQLNDPRFGIGLARSIGQKMGINPEDVLPQPSSAPAYTESGAPAAAAAFMQGFAKPLAHEAAIPVGLVGGIASRLGNDSLFKTYDQMTGDSGSADIAKSPVAGQLGQLGGSLAGFALAPSIGGASDIALVSKLAQSGAAGQKLAPVVAHILENAPGALAAGGLPQGSEAAQKTLQQGGTLGQAVGEGLAGTGLGSAQFLVPTSLEGNALVRGASGFGIQQALNQAQQQAQHAIAPDVFQSAQAPDLSNPMTYLGAALGLAGGHGDVTPFAEPGIGKVAGDVQAPGTAEPPGPRALPPPDSAPPTSTAPKAPVAPPVTDLPTAAGAFIADPKAALTALDPVVLHQVASDAGFTIRPGTAPATIVDTMMGKGTPFLHSDVLPEYMAALQEHGLPYAVSAPLAGSPPTPTPAPPEPQDFAQALKAGNSPVAVDTAGTAYTPQQGASELGQAIGNRPPAAPALPAPVTTVDKAGTAMTSADFLTKTRAAQQEAESLQSAVLHRQNLGITPDIERTQGPRWDAQRNAEAAGGSELATQREDDSPPWWLAGQQADEEATAARAAQNATKLQTAIHAPGPANAPMHPWTPIDANVDVPYAGGQSKDLSKAFIDRRIPQTMEIAGKTIDVHEAIGLHENIESSLIHNTKVWKPAELDALAQRVGLQSAQDFPALVREKLYAGKALSYVQGHNIATKGENHLVATKYGVPAAKYQMGLQSSIKAALKHGTGAANVPTELDTKPYDNMGESHLVPQQDDAYQQHLTELAGERQAMSGDDRARAAAFLTEAGVPQADHDEAIALIQLADRAYDAGAEPRDILTDPAMSPSAKARALYDLAAKQETLRAEPSRSAPRLEAGDGSETQGLTRPRAANDQALGQAAATEPGRGVPEAAHQVGRPSRVEEGVSEPADGGVAGRRTDWTPALEKASDAAVDSLVERYRGSTLADSIAKEFKEHQGAALIGQAIKSHQDLAALARIYRSPVIETARYMFVDADGTVLGETAVSSRKAGSSIIFPVGEDDGAAWLIKAAPEGTTGVWMVHNHPSGNPKPSSPDLEATGSLGIQLGDTSRAPKLLGHVVLDHDTFGQINASGEDMGIGKLPMKGSDPLRDRRGADLFDVKMTSPAFAASTGKHIADMTPKDSTAVVIMGAQGEVVSVHTFPNEVLAGPRGGALLSRLAAKKGGLGIGIVTRTDTFAQFRTKFDDASNRSLLYDAVVVTPNGKAIQLGNHPELMPKRSLLGKQSSGAVQSGNSGVKVYEGAQEPAPISLTMVKEALRNRGMSEESIAGMSRAELRAEQASLRARSEPTPEQKDTGVKNATKEEERAMKGKAAVEHDLSTSNPAQYATAKARFDADPHAGQILAAKVISDKKAITPEDSILLGLDAMRIINARQTAYEQAEKALDRGDEATRVASLSLIHQLDGQMEANDMASRYAGVRAGQALQARKVMIAQDYSMARMVLRAKVAKGADLTAAERTKLEAAANAIAQRTKELDAREAKLRAMEAEARPVAAKRAAKVKFDDLVNQLKAIAEKDHMKPGCVS
jgi:hypothetical protein